MKKYIKTGLALGTGYLLGRKSKNVKPLLGAVRPINGSAKNIDKDLINETYNFVMNDYETYNILTDIYFKNLKKKKKKGILNAEKAYLLLGTYFLNNYVRREMKKPEKYGFDPKMTPAERKEFGKMLYEDFKEYY